MSWRCSNIVLFKFYFQIVPTAHVVPTTEIAQGKPVAPVVPSQATKQVAKQVSKTIKKNNNNNQLFLKKEKKKKI